MSKPFALSILDLAPIAEGSSTPDAPAETIRLAQLGDALGYTRLWYAEHHGMASIASSSPEVLIASAAAHTKNIRVGSGGVMLLNHAPLRIAEAFRTLEALHPGRVDLGSGRAPGGDGYAMRALRSGGGEEFSTYLAEMMAFDEDNFPTDHPFSRVPVAPGGIRLPPSGCWVRPAPAPERPANWAWAMPLPPISATPRRRLRSRPIAMALNPAKPCPSRAPFWAFRWSAPPPMRRRNTSPIPGLCNGPCSPPANSAA
ncbi:MsnO8 family LLM class oxidoreductase [Devosia sp. A8/3-2]|nr:MsnO8 family LLM class oxidoreductase [Devosia sp. A8/3-2]